MCESCGYEALCEEWERATNKTEVGKMPIELPVKETVTVAEGRHDFRVMDVKERKEPFHYIDVYFHLKDADVTIKDGYSANITENTKLGKLLKTLGVNVSVGTRIELEQALIGKEGTLMTINEKTDKGTFARVVDGSIQLRPVF